ncbi:uncharacterized protein MONBRDRAFT_36198 [Monosiga brevicollis MX1]|uniref:Uncharacterized protein n=1 Tax=Monosiga brevicollis TaxID=81824 RepID=A9UTQ5_MONBE|nr:uncharacterized protein MONBRDRAFT_36198 [Monosiga brevicollis MX1]EDQ91531.1 predicted protein [Monosiga brevicollis MX1]|eukprot:XP_001743953.1 hypothetical protein [Monosiga brevicollis MX1]
MAEASSSSRALFERFQADFPSSCHSKLRQLLRLARPDDLSLDSPGHVACPICAAEMPLDQVDAHIEAGCPPAETPSSTTKIPMPGPVPGGVTPPAKREKPNPPTEASQTQEESPAAISAPKVKSKSKDKPPAAVSSRGSSRGGSGNLHAFFGGEDTTVPGYFVLHRTAGLPTHATFEREAPPGFQALQHTFTWEGKQVWTRDKREKHILSGAQLKAPPTLTRQLLARLGWAKSAQLPPSLPIDGVRTSRSIVMPSCFKVIYRCVSDDLVEFHDVDPGLSSAFTASHRLRARARLGHTLLKKCVRRCRAELAVCSARELLLFDPIKVLRRLPVIMIEDGQLLECLPALVWYMVALSKSYRLSDADTAFLLGVVHAVAASPFKDGAVTWGEVDEKFNGRHIVKVSCRSIPCYAQMCCHSIRWYLLTRPCSGLGHHACVGQTF